MKADTRLRSRSTRAVLRILTWAVVVVPVIMQQPAASEVIFCRYIEGTGNNKAIELHYVGPDSVRVMDGYRLELYSNGSATVTVLLVPKRRSICLT